MHNKIEHMSMTQDRVGQFNFNNTVKNQTQSSSALNAILQNGTMLTHNQPIHKINHEFLDKDADSSKKDSYNFNSIHNQIPHSTQTAKNINHDLGNPNSICYEYINQRRKNVTRFPKYNLRNFNRKLKENGISLSAIDAIKNIKDILQSSIEKSLNAVLDSYITDYFKIALENIKLNSVEKITLDEKEIKFLILADFLKKFSKPSEASLLISDFTDHECSDLDSFSKFISRESALKWLQQERHAQSSIHTQNHYLELDQITKLFDQNLKKFPIQISDVPQFVVLISDFVLFANKIFKNSATKIETGRKRKRDSLSHSKTDSLPQCIPAQNQNIATSNGCTTVCDSLDRDWIIPLSSFVVHPLSFGRSVDICDKFPSRSASIESISLYEESNIDSNFLNIVDGGEEGEGQQPLFFSQYTNNIHTQNEAMGVTNKVDDESNSNIYDKPIHFFCEILSQSPFSSYRYRSNTLDSGMSIDACLKAPLPTALPTEDAFFSDEQLQFLLSDPGDSRQLDFQGISRVGMVHEVSETLPVLHMTSGDEADGDNSLGSNFSLIMESGVENRSNVIGSQPVSTINASTELLFLRSNSSTQSECHYDWQTSPQNPPELDRYEEEDEFGEAPV